VNGRVGAGIVAIGDSLIELVAVRAQWWDVVAQAVLAGQARTRWVCLPLGGDGHALRAATVISRAFDSSRLGEQGQDDPSACKESRSPRHPAR